MSLSVFEYSAFHPERHGCKLRGQRSYILQLIYNYPYKTATYSVCIIHLVSYWHLGFVSSAIPLIII